MLNAFDKVWHEGFIYILQKYGIRGEILGWIEDYINDRTQTIVNNGYSLGTLEYLKDQY